MKYTCKRCGHIWNPRTQKFPKSCPGCHSYKWFKKLKVLKGGQDGKNKDK